MGAAIVLVQFADLAVAAESAVFHYPETQLGVSGGMIASMAARIPHKIAMELLIAGTKFSAQRAFEVGMINKSGTKWPTLECSYGVCIKIAQ